MSRIRIFLFIALFHVNLFAVDEDPNLKKDSSATQAGLSGPVCDAGCAEIAAQNLKKLIRNSGQIQDVLKKVPQSAASVAVEAANANPETDPVAMNLDSRSTVNDLKGALKFNAGPCKLKVKVGRKSKVDCNISF